LPGKDRLRVEEAPQDHVWFLENMDRLNRAMQGSDDLEQVLRDVFDEMLAIFVCDRAFLLSPCDPAAGRWQALMERTQPECPGIFVLGLELPLTPSEASLHRTLRETEGPVPFHPQAQQPLAPELAKRFCAQSMLAIAMYPKIGKPFVLGLHQCSQPRAWTPEEQRLFQEIARRLADALTSLLLLRNLRESEARFRRLVDHATDAFFLHGESGIILDVNRQACESLGYTREELIGMSPYDLDANADHALPAKLEARLETGEVFSFDSYHRRKDGTVFPVEVRIRLFQEDGYRFSVSLARDITERKRMEDALLLFRTLIDHAQDSIEIIDLDSGRILDVNEKACLDHGYTRQEYLALHVFDLDTTISGPADLVHHVQNVRHGSSFLHQGQHRRKDGSTFPVEVKVTCVHLDRSFLLAIVRDVTEQKRLEEHLFQAQKMEAIGRLSGGVAHDFNNLLTVIRGYSQVVFNDLAQDDPNRGLLGEILRAGERASNLTRQLLAFSRRQPLLPRVVSLNSLLGELVTLLQRLIGEDIALRLVPDDLLGLARVDSGQFEQAVINLALNARDAMPHGGELTIETRNTVLTEGDDWCPEVGPGRYVQMEVRDSGNGMDKETLGRIFEPFFTTKGPGQGTGLGLAMVYGFVKQSGGHITVESQPGQGTTFRMHLPCSAEEDLPVMPLPDRPKALRGTETVLVAEDERSVRDLVRGILQTGGYTVLEAADGQEAVEVAQAFQGPIHLLLSDLVMPRMNGRLLADVLVRSRPVLRVLFMSGYTDEAVLGQETAVEGVAFLAKPFSPSELARKVREALDGVD